MEPTSTDQSSISDLRPSSILETVIYNADLEAALWFYHEVLGFPICRDMDDLGFAVRINEDRVLVVFDPRESDKPGRDVPSHGARGPGHIAFRIDDSEYGAWKAKLSSFGIGIESEIEWTEAHHFFPGRSIYFRDPYSNSVELITSDIWKGPSS